MSRFSIDFRWLNRDYGDAVERATFAEITITADGRGATELEDSFSKTVRSGVRVSAFALAQWLAANWWRLLWEPERNTPAWKMSHMVGAAGEGYLWPDLAFASDGGAVLIHCRPTPPAPKSPVRYLNGFDVFLPVGEFEEGMYSFISAVVGRLTDRNVAAEEFESLWKEVNAERLDPALAAWRKLEAVMGYDPDEAPPEIIAALHGAADEYGAGAVQEVAAEAMDEALHQIEALWGDPCRGAFPLTIPLFDILRERIIGEIPSSLFPWQKATHAARIAREVWSLGSGPVSGSRLAEIFSILEDSLAERTRDVKGPMNAGFRNGEADGFKAFLKSPYRASRRFALLRLVGDHLTAPPGDRLLPAAARARTQRQKFQRAFAQEFLCPYADLLSYLGSTEFAEDTDAVEDAARFFDVSPVMIQTLLVNKGVLERSVLS